MAPEWASIEAYTLKDKKGKGEDGSAAAVNITNKEDIKLIGSDIRYIKQGQYPIMTGTSYFFHSVGYYAAIGIPLLLFLLFVGYAEYQRKQ